MSSHYGIDEAWARLTPDQVKATGKEFIVGYVSEDTTGKNITREEVQTAHDAGLGVLLVYEYSTTAVHGGASKGTVDATTGITHVRLLGNYPTGCALAFAVDENTSANPSVVDDYARAFTLKCHVEGFRSMVYGGLATVKRCADLGLADLFWQTYAWSGGQWDSRATIRQIQNGVVIDGKDVDIDLAMVDDYGAWMPTTTIQKVDDDMLMLVQDTRNETVYLTNGVFARVVPAAQVSQVQNYLSNHWKNSPNDGAVVSVDNDNDLGALCGVIWGSSSSDVNVQTILSAIPGLVHTELAKVQLAVAP